MPNGDHEKQNDEFMSTKMLSFMKTAPAQQAVAAVAATLSTQTDGARGTIAMPSSTLHSIDEAVRMSRDPCARFIAAVAAMTGESVEELVGLSDWRKDLEKQLHELDTRVGALRDEAVKKLLESAAKESKLELLAAAGGTADDAQNGDPTGDSVVLQLRDAETASRLRDLQSGDATAGFFDRFSALIDKQKSDADLTLRDTLASLDESIFEMARRGRQRIKEHAKLGGDELLSLSHRLRTAMEEAVTAVTKERGGRPLLLSNVINEGVLALRTAFAELVGLVYLSHSVKNSGMASYMTASSITELVIRSRVALRRVIIELRAARV